MAVNYTWTQMIDQQLIANPDLTPGFVEETLRFLTPVNNMWRLVK